MIRSIVKIGLLLLVGILFYNYFFGTESEKQQSKEIFHSAKELGQSAWGLIRSEKEKFDEGKYDEALDKIGGLFNNLKDRAEDLEDSGLLDRINDLESKRDQLEQEVNEKSPEDYDQQDKDRLRKEWDRLTDDTEEVIKELDRRE